MIWSYYNNILPKGEEKKVAVSVTGQTLTWKAVSQEK